MRKHYDDPRQAATLRAIVLDCLSAPKQDVARELGYLELPEDVVARIRAEVDKVNSAGVTSL
jgi:hypothetical protein